nr:hypothetical protein [Candidatus Gracilibacteria bacterium]
MKIFLKIIIKYLILISLAIGIISAFAITFPTGTPSGETSGGLFKYYINKILVNTNLSTTDGTVKKANLLVNNNSDCGSGKYLQGFDGSGNIICVTPSGLKDCYLLADFLVGDSGIFKFCPTSKSSAKIINKATLSEPILPYNNGSSTLISGDYFYNCTPHCSSLSMSGATAYMDDGGGWFVGSGFGFYNNMLGRTLHNWEWEAVCWFNINSTTLELNYNSYEGNITGINSSNSKSWCESLLTKVYW